MTTLQPAVELYNTKKPLYLRSEGLNLCQIEIIENYFYTEINHQFPLALKEMLYLAGGSSIFDTGCYLKGDEVYTQDINTLLRYQNRLWLTKPQRQYFLHNRPVWIFNNTPEADNYEDFSFVYLDEQEDNPLVWRFVLDNYIEQLFLQKGGWDHSESKFLKDIRLVDYINNRITYKI